MIKDKKNFKQYRNTVIILGIALILVAAYIWVLPLITPKGEDEDPKNKDNPEAVQLIKVDEATIEHLLIDNKERIIELEYQPAKAVNNEGEEYDTYQWVMKQPTGYTDLDQLLIRGITTNLCDIVSTKIIEENPTDLSTYGLENPKTITATLTNGEKIVVRVGNKAPLTTASYVTVNDDPTVYTIKSYTAGKITPIVNQLRTTTIFNFDSSKVAKIAMGRDGEKLFGAERTQDDVWMLDYPIPADSNNEAIVGLVDSLITLFRQSFVEENPTDLSKYHLDEPYYEFEIETIDGETRHIYLGKEDKTDLAFYARFDDNKEVFKVPSAGLTYIDKPLTEIVQLFCYIVNYKNVDKLEVSIKGEPDQVSIIKPHETDTSKDVFYVNGKEATMKDEEGHQVWRLYYQSVIGVLLKDIDIEATPTGEPEITFTYHQNDGAGIVKVEFIPADDNQTYYCMLNGEYTGMIVDRREFYGRDGVLEQYENLMKYVNAQ